MKTLRQQRARCDKGKCGAATDCIYFSMKAPLWCGGRWTAPGRWSWVETLQRMSQGMSEARVPAFSTARDRGNTSRERWDFSLCCTSVVSGSVLSVKLHIAYLLPAYVCVFPPCQPNISSFERVNNNPLSRYE